MLKDEVFTNRKPWVDWKRLREVVAKAKAQNLPVRSSNFYSTTLRNTSPQCHLKFPKNTIARGVPACQLMGFTAMPTAVCDVYDAAPSRGVWKAMLKQWLYQASTTCAGAFGHYYMKCCLDRLCAVKQIDHDIISWWPTDCPSYRTWYKLLYVDSKDFSEEDHYQALCAIYRKLHSAHRCTFPEALAQQHAGP